MMHLNLDKKINENDYTEHIVKLLKSPADVSLDEYS